ncbi:MAG: DUF1835 domain-containing protein [Flammeovirgaceae bacterium]
MTTLHILNGDGTHYNFKEAKIAGDIAIWREVLCEGPAGNLSEPSFWKQREDFLNQRFESNDAHFEQHVLAEFNKIQAFQHYQEIVLWFEHDLFCQLNLLGLLSWFAQQELHDITLSLVCIHEHPNHPNFHGLGELAPHEFPDLYDRRQKLSPQMLDFAHQAWQHYINPDLHQFSNFLDRNSFEGFPYLKEALQLHLKRFPRQTTGLNSQESRIIHKIADQTVISTKELMRYLLRTDNYAWGFGDLQYFNIIDDLAPLIEKKEDGYTLTPLGHQVIQGKKSFFPYRTQKIALAGGYQSDWYWSENNTISKQEGFSS